MLSLWEMTAGVRSIFMLPKITESASFYKLQKKFSIKNDKPFRLIDHWQVFKDIASHEDFIAPWEIELLFFPKAWIESLHDPKWQEFKSYISHKAWLSSEFWRNQFCWDLTLSRIHANRNIKPCSFIADIASHLLALSVGALPGFRALIGEREAPISGLQHVFINDYGLSYAPIIIGPQNFSIFTKQNYPVYYSFHYHTAIKLSQKSSKKSSITTDLYNLRSLLNKYIEDILNNDKIRNTALYEVASNTNFEFCHHNAPYDINMKQSYEILRNDSAFHDSIQNYSLKEMPKNGPFLNGSIQISMKVN